MSLYHQAISFEPSLFKWVDFDKARFDNSDQNVSNGVSEFPTAKNAWQNISSVKLPNPNISETSPKSSGTNSMLFNSRAVTSSRFATNQDTHVERIAKQRVQLLALKYANKNVSSEIVARLEILNSRLLNYAPRVSKQQVEVLENANNRLDEIKLARAKLSKRLGIAA